MAKPIRQLSNINAVIQKGLAAAVEIFDQLDAKEEEDTGEVDSAIVGNIEFSDVTFSYTYTETVLSNLNFKILLEIIIFMKQIIGIIINFWSKYKQHELKKLVANNNIWAL